MLAHAGKNQRLRFVHIERNGFVDDWPAEDREAGRSTEEWNPRPFGRLVAEQDSILGLVANQGQRAERFA